MKESPGTRDPKVTHTPQATHPPVVADSQAALQLLEGSVLAAPVLAHLWAVYQLGSVGGGEALGYRTQVSKGVEWNGLTILGPHWVPASTRPKSSRSIWASGSAKAPRQATSPPSKGTMESTGTVYGTRGLGSPPWHCSFPH